MAASSGLPTGHRRAHRHGRLDVGDYYTAPLAEVDEANAHLFIPDIRACASCDLHRWHIENALACPGWFPQFGIDILFVGMSPGEEEDKKGRPFVGRAGQKLMSLANRVKLFEPMDGLPVTFGLTNIVRCHTPSNRPPTGLETEACRRWLDVELDMADPIVVILLGNSAIEFAFPGKKIGEVAGDARAVATAGSSTRIYIASYHPAAILHRPDENVERSILKSFSLARELLMRRSNALRS